MTRLRVFGSKLWTAEGPTISFYGFRYPTRMAIARLANGDLFIWSPVALDDMLQTEVDALGRVAHLVSHNKLHHLYLAQGHPKQVVIAHGQDARENGEMFIRRAFRWLG